MHQAIGKIPVIGKEKQAFRIEIQTTDSQPFAVFERWQVIENGCSFFRIVTTDDFTGRFVVKHDFRKAFRHFALQEFPIDAYLIRRQDSLADMSRFTIDGNASGNDQFFHVATGTETGIGKHLVKLGSVVFSPQFTFGILLFRWCICRSVTLSIDFVVIVGSHKPENVACIVLVRILAVLRCIPVHFGDRFSGRFFSGCRFVGNRFGSGIVHSRYHTCLISSIRCSFCSG